ncbi:hypothetical protein BHM03_00054749 [Ensete ventricosum]|nr:hypothetical protein BHM03_00054749 [Ensete ventricosum]
MELEDNQRLPGSDAAEKKKVASLRALVEGQNPAAKVPPPPTQSFSIPISALALCLQLYVTDFIIAQVQNRYPERLGKAYLIQVPYIFMKVWKIIYQFLDKNTKEKVIALTFLLEFYWNSLLCPKIAVSVITCVFIFIENKDLKATLLEDIDESQLPEIYGGKLPLVPVEESTV